MLQGVKRDEWIQIRVNTKEKNRIKGLANLYAQGDLSTWIRWAAINGERKFLRPIKSRTPKKP